MARNLAVHNTTQLHRTVAHVLTVAALLGLVCTAFTLLIGVPFVLPAMVGPHTATTTTTTLLLLYARRYVYIRASVAVASIVAVTSQSILLATKDTITPFVAVVATSVTNIVGDILLRYYGVQGAATATALATIVSCTILLRAVHQQYTAWKNAATTTTDATAQRDDRTVTTTTTPPKLTLANMCQGWVRTIWRPGKSIVAMWSLPDKEATLQLMTLAGPYVQRLKQ